ncbi:hypothetical protein GALMADRAFT_144421 [Galerina marginata CBS 339.88]|uniref:DNA replication regulator Sld3 C-terminal domain-containing protein n=1 Tax=Galerina marginata (strain CBS 339.88) TaxID=685588 RepID=A0A067SJ64_GALM3|nr:hypothetical protein GALMADRAFT_144421 [Galerina marginata CBS 339.88]
MVDLSPTWYRFDDRKIANWTTNQEKTISTDYPFHTESEPLDQYVARIYLQFLWLPESIMPLHLLVPSLRRVNAPSTSDASVHPMHAFLDPLLLTTRLVNNKYHVELPRILADGGGAGEMEETMMWYSLTHEKGNGNAQVASEEADGPWVDDGWRQAYMNRMERREVQIQILLLLYKLSLPGPPPPEKKKKKRFKVIPEPTLTTEDHLETFMDKLSTWQLIGALDRTKPATGKTEERHWTQAFVQDVVEREFKAQSPELCSLLRSKVFPGSPFSDDDVSQASTSRVPSPEPVPRALSRAPSTSQLPSPTLSTSSRTTKLKPLARSRSRSLSVSLAREQKERERASNAPPKKRVLNREISMSRVFKPKLKHQPVAVKTAKTEPIAQPPKPKASNLGITLVEETPVKQRVASSTAVSFGQPNFTFAFGKFSSKAAETKEHDDDDDEEWMMDSSPDITFLNPRRGSIGTVEMNDDGEDDDEGDGMATPSKPSRKAR